MIDKRLIPFFDTSKHFLEVSSINECLLEAKNTQQYLADLIHLRSELENDLRSQERRYKLFFAKVRDETYRTFKKYDYSPTERNIEDSMVNSYPKEYDEFKEAIDVAKINYEACQSLVMAMFQRKDIIAETISFFKSKLENDNCLAKSQAFLKKLGVKL